MIRKAIIGGINAKIRTNHSCQTQRRYRLKYLRICLNNFFMTLPVFNTQSIFNQFHLLQPAERTFQTNFSSFDNDIYHFIIIPIDSWLKHTANVYRLFMRGSTVY